MKVITFEWQLRETIHEGGDAKDTKAKARASTYDGNRKEMVRSQSISSSLNERKLLGENKILQIKREENEACNKKNWKNA